MEDDLVGLERKDIGCQGFIYMFPVSAMEGRAMMEEFQNVQELNALEHGTQTWNMNIEPKIASLKQETHLQNAVWGLHVFVSRVFRQLETFMIAKLCLEVGIFGAICEIFRCPKENHCRNLNLTVSMYGIFTYIWLKFVVNMGEYTIHGSCGKPKRSAT